MAVGLVVYQESQEPCSGCPAPLAGSLPTAGPTAGMPEKLETSSVLPAVRSGVPVIFNNRLR